MLVPAVLSDGFSANNLRYLSPESATSRQVLLFGNIYPFSVLGYEFVTRSRIEGGRDRPDGYAINLLSDIHHHINFDIVPVQTFLQREAQFGAYKPTLPPVELSEIIH
jgi:hypothetical protein